MAALTDTTAEAERVWVGVWRAMSPGKKWLILGEAFRTAKLLHAAGYRLRHPGATDEEIVKDWLLQQYGFSVPEQREASGSPHADKHLMRGGL